MMDAEPHREDSNVREVDDPAPLGASVKNSKALVIGVDAYPAGFRSLNNAVNDARAVGQVLQADYEFVVTLLVNEQASQAAIQNAIGQALRSGPDLRWLFYFAGHGTVIQEQGYLLPADVEKSEVGKMLPLLKLLEECLNSDCAEVRIILDACYSGRGFVRSENLDLPAPSIAEQRVRQIITSGNPNQPVLDAGAEGHSIFTQALLETLRGWTGAHDEHGAITFPKLRDELAYQIPARLRASKVSTLSQQPLGGNFQGNSQGREFTFVPRTGVQRFNPEIVSDLSSGDSERRVSGFHRLARDTTNATRLQAVEMALHALQKDLSEEVRVAAAQTLGLYDDVRAVPALIDALGDSVPVCRASTLSLSWLKDPAAAPALFQRLQKTGDELFLDLADAIGSLGDPVVILKTLREALQRGKLVPFLGPDLPQELTGVKSRSSFIVDFARYAGVAPSDSLAQVAEIATQSGRQLHSLVQALRKAYANQPQQPGPLYTALRQFNISYWLSACYDDHLTRALNANSIAMGEDIRHWRSGRPTIVRLTGDAGSIRGLVVLEKEYEILRENEGDRKLLLGFMQQELQGKVVLLMGFDPASRDFGLLASYILNQHLSNLQIRAFLIWQESPQTLFWGKHQIHRIQLDLLELIRNLQKGGSE